MTTGSGRGIVRLHRDAKETDEMNAQQIQQLARLAADIAETDGSNVTSITMAEMADGSRRYYALVNTDTAGGDGLEQTYRATTEAPADAPAWARRYDRETVEVELGSGWMELELYAANDDGFTGLETYSEKPGELQTCDDDETAAEELGRLRRELTELHHDTPEYATTLDRIAVLVREHAAARRASLGR